MAASVVVIILSMVIFKELVSVVV
jgi:hypothetical protein